MSDDCSKCDTELENEAGPDGWSRRKMECARAYAWGVGQPMPTPMTVQDQLQARALLADALDEIDRLMDEWP
jgi:hypothetical protein